jgi:hypothetical protein
VAIAWYNNPIDSIGGSYGQMADPLGSYLKPDVNVGVPTGTPITALASGTVSSVIDLGRNSGGLSVTVALDKPLNALATHISYNYLGSATTRVGDHVVAGQQIAIAGSIYGIDMAVGLTPDSQWGNGSFALNAAGNPQLDPHIILNAVRSGAPLPFSSALSSFSTSGVGQTLQTISDATYQTINNIPGFLGIVEALDIAETFQPFTLPDNAGVLGKVPILGGVIQQIQLPADTLQAVLVFIVDNTLATLVRGLIIFIGIVILVALIKNATSAASVATTGQTPGQLAGSAIKLGMAFA